MVIELVVRQKETWWWNEEEVAGAVRETR